MRSSAPFASGSRRGAAESRVRGGTSGAEGGRARLRTARTTAEWRAAAGRKRGQVAMPRQNCAAGKGAAAEPEGSGGSESTDEGEGGKGQGIVFLNPVFNFFRKSWSKGKELDKEKLASLGASVLLSYGFVSNVNACTLTTIAWVICGRTTGLSPLAVGNWKTFLGIYGGLYLSFGNLLRPIRASVALAISPLFERLVSGIESKLKVKRSIAFGLTVFFVNVIGSITYFALIISGACLLCNVPLLPPAKPA